MKSTLSAHEWFEKVQIAFQKAANTDKASAMEAYMKYQFQYLGIQKPIRAELTRSLFNQFNKPTLETCEELVPMLWDLPIREYHYFAMECLFHQRKQFNEHHLVLFEELMLKHSWWDTIDFISPVLTASVCQKYPELLSPTALRWNYNSNFWLQRASILIQLKYKKETNIELQFQLIQNRMNEKKFFIRKAIGWSLRELAKSFPKKVVLFVENNPISNLSRREALKHLG